MDEKVRQIFDVTVNDLQTIMDVSVAQRLKDTAKSIMGRSVRTKDPMFWPAGMLLLGLISAAEDEAVRPVALNAIHAHTNKWLSDYGGQIDYVDDALAGFCFVRAYEYTNDPLYKEAADKMAEFIAKSPRDNDGSVIYNPGRNSTNIFADGVGQVSMFMAAYKKIFGEGDIAISAGGKLSASAQLKSFRAHGFDEKSRLNYHGYSIDEAAKKGLLGWGRAFGWLFMGVCESALNPEEGEDFDVMAWYRLLCNTALDYQRLDGGWSWQLQAVDGHIDMSATGMIAYSIARGVKSEILKGDGWVNALDKAQKCMLSHTVDGKVMDALSSCDDFGVHYQTYGNYPWGQGAVLAALSLIE